MAISKKEVKYIANLAKLGLSEKEAEMFGHQLSAILDYMEKLNELDTSKVEPLSYPVSLKNILRADEIEPSLEHGLAKRKAPQSMNGFFQVPNVIDGL